MLQEIRRDVYSFATWCRHDTTRAYSVFV